jgi:hypothetical protein
MFVGGSSAIREEFLGRKAPASTLVEIRALAHPDRMIEIEAIAVIWALCQFSTAIPAYPGERRITSGPAGRQQWPSLVGLSGPSVFSS